MYEGMKERILARIPFDDIECGIVNNICDGELMSTLTREFVMAHLNAAINFANSDLFDETGMIGADVYEPILAKFERMSDAEWDDMKIALPFPLPYTPEDEDFDPDVDGAEEE